MSVELKWSCLAFATVCLLSSTAITSADQLELSLAEGEKPVSVEQLEPMAEKAESEPDEKSRSGQAYVYIDSYYSSNLKANLLLKRFQIANPQTGAPYFFWGARVVGMKDNSPLRKTGIRIGDVISRLDGVPISNGAYMTPQGYRAVPQAERHYSKTEVKWVRSGTHEVRRASTFLGGPGGGGELP